MSAPSRGPLRLLHVFAPAPAGGLESVVQLLASGLRAHGAEVAVVAVLGEGTPEPASVLALRASGMTVYCHRAPPRGYRTELLAHRRLIEGWRPQVVHTHGYRADVLAGLAVGRRAPRVTTVHGFTGGDWKNLFYEWLQVRAYRRFDAVIAVSRPLRDRLQKQGIRASRLELIPNAYRTVTHLSRSAARAELGLPIDAAVIGWVGRLSPEKGADVLLRAVAQLPDAGIRVALVGEGPERAALMEQAAALGVSERITWFGMVTGAGRLMAAFDVFVVSSRTEGTPMALLEAMATGVPAVASSVGGIPDMLDASQGWLVASDSPNRLAAAIGEVLASPAEARTRAARAQERLMRDFAMDPWIDRHIELYLRLRDGRHTPRS